MTEDEFSCCKINNVSIKGLSPWACLLLSTDLLEFLSRAWQIIKMYDNKESSLNATTKTFL